jgi:hypothetical protein
MAATATIPIVLYMGGDQVVASLNRSGGNLTALGWLVLSWEQNG